jgi:hypothetical protein
MSDGKDEKYLQMRLLGKGRSYRREKWFGKGCGVEGGKASWEGMGKGARIGGCLGHG